MSRRVVQIAVAMRGSGGVDDDYEERLFALCDDGSCWTLDVARGVGAQWTRLPGVPQDAPPAGDAAGA